MNTAILLVVAGVLFLIAYKIYARYIAKKFDENDKNPTPAVNQKDDVDYVPTKPIVLFGHHFASIAGGGPIIGPTVALMFGYIPLWLWIVLGAIFIGAVHDYSALFASVRQKGKSIAEIAQTSLGKTGFFLFISLTFLLLLLLTSSFLGLTATALTSAVPLDMLRLDVSQTIVKTITDSSGIIKAQIGGIASSSVIFITCCAPFLGFLIYKKNINVILAVILAIIVCICSIFVGLNFPISMKPIVWMIILTIYTIFAAGIPVWLVLQPRDFTNSFMLYGGIIALFIGGIVAGIKGVTINAPALNIAEGSAKIGMIWPFLFITVACGAVSGFHSLVACGTTSKQLAKESDGKKIAFGGMLIEGLLAVGILVAIGAGLGFQDYTNIVFPTVKGVSSNPILAFALGSGGLLYTSFGIPPIYGTVFGIILVEGFVVTTLDTAVRLNRYIFEELWQFVFKKVPKILKSYLFNAVLCAGLMFLLSYFNAFLIIWPIFGSANQLLAALTLIAVSVWLLMRGKKILFTIIPAGFMMITTLFSLTLLLIKKYIPNKNIPLSVTAVLLIILSIGVIVLAVKKFREIKG